MKYFAYGSNMNPERLKKRNVNFYERKKASLKGYDLSFDKKAKDGEFGYATIQPSNDEQPIQGAIYEIDDKDLKQLDKYEGYPEHYDKIEVEILDENNIPVKAITYIAKPEKIVAGLKPTKEYLSHLLAGKDILSDDYFNNLSKTETVD